MADNPFAALISGDGGYSAMLDPNKQGTITGFLGGLMGRPTASQAAGDATGRALQSLAQLRQQGATPQQALLQFLQTDEGKDYFTNAGKDGIKNLTDALTASTPPAPEKVTLAPGTNLYNRDPTSGALTLMASQPTAEMQNFNNYASLAQLPPQRIRELAELQLDKTKAPSEKKQAIQNLIDNYGLDPRLGAAMLADQVKLLPVKDQFGQDTGNSTVVDLTNNTSTMLTPGNRVNAGPDSDVVVNRPVVETRNGQPVTPPSAVPAAKVGTTPETGAKTGIIPAAKVEPDPTKDSKYFGDKASMVLGGGLVPNILGAASKAGEQIDSSLILPEGAKANDRDTMLKISKNAILSMADTGFGANKVQVQSYADLVPSGGITESPHDNVQKFIRLHQYIDQEIASEEAASVDRSLPTQERAASAKRANGWKKVLRTIPTMEELDRMNKAIINGTAGAPNVRTGMKALGEQVRQVGKSAKDQAAGVQEDLTQQGNIAAMSLEQLLALNPRELNAQQRQQLARRIQQLKGGANGQ